MKTANSTTNNNTPVFAGFANSAFVKASAKYLADALGEGIKQSLNGMDINVEFITLTARSLAQTSGNMVKKFISKYSNEGRQLADRRYNYNNNTTLSHS
ncbi:hypothetical protein A0256_14840 [Mucilaginibacter sp. PAMC 26640]|nr:hypothetical protein A0256_14840 [Mucilaginibacter sp. PAMC 26640]